MTVQPKIQHAAAQELRGSRLSGRPRRGSGGSSTNANRLRCVQDPTTAIDGTSSRQRFQTDPPPPPPDSGCEGPFLRGFLLARRYPPPPPPPPPPAPPPPPPPPPPLSPPPPPPPPTPPPPSTARLRGNRGRVQATDDDSGRAGRVARGCHMVAVGAAPRVARYHDRNEVIRQFHCHDVVRNEQVATDMLL